MAVVISHVTGHGVKGQALQCDLCECWYHAMCENFGSKQYCNGRSGRGVSPTSSVGRSESQHVSKDLTTHVTQN